MYDNIGRKIKGFAKASFIVAAIAEVIAGIALMPTDEDLIVYGLLVMVVGPIVAWVSSWLLYGFGEIIDKVSEIAKNTRTSQPTSTTDNNQEHREHIENSKKISSAFKADGIMDIPKRNK